MPHALCPVQHGGNLPTTVADKAAFKDLIARFARPSIGHAENIEEAIHNVHLATASSAVKEDVLDVLHDSAADAVTATTPPFWVVVHALREFFITHGYLPLPGDLPDMTSTSDLYITLQRIFRAQAAAEFEEIRARVRELGTAAGIPAENAVSDDDIALMCKNGQHLRMIRFHPLSGELAWDSTTHEYVTIEPKR